MQSTRVATFNIDTLLANTQHTIRVYFGSANYATNTIATAVGSTTALATGGSVAVREVSIQDFTITSNASGTVSFDFKRLPTATGGYWGVYGVDIAQNASDLPTAFPQMLSDISFDESGLTEETRTRIAAHGLQGQVLDEPAVLAARDAAIAAWASSGISPEQLQDLLASPVVIGDLSADGQLGLALGDQIVLDDDAMGLGWFVGGAGEEVPAGMIDLLTVMTHEFGHRLGYYDLDAANYPGHIMAGSLQPGERRSVATARPVTVQPAVAQSPASIDRPVEIERTDLFAAAVSAEASVASRISPLAMTSDTLISTAAVNSAERQTLESAPFRLIGEPASASGSASASLSLLDDLFADLVTTLDALN
jgi:hypothetical protein